MRPIVVKAPFTFRTRSATQATLRKHQRRSRRALAASVALCIVGSLVAPKPVDAAADRIVDLWILSGQSNARGHGEVVNLTATQKAAWLDAHTNNPNITFSYNIGTKHDPPTATRSWGPIVAQPIASGPLRYGPEFGFAAHAYANREPGVEKVAIVKFAAGGTSLADWYPDGSPTRYGDAIKFITDEIAKLRNVHPDHHVRLRGLLWVQGESDAVQEELYTNYGSNLLNLWTTFRADLDADAPLIFAPVSETARRQPERRIVNANARSAAADWDNFEVSASTNDLVLRADGVHYDAASQIVLGHQLFATAQDMGPADVAAAELPSAEWMEESWGVRVLLPSGDSAENFDAVTLIDEVASIPDISWVQLNVTRGAGGDLFTAPIPWLEQIMGSHIAPSHDLLGDAIQRAKHHGLRVFVYAGSTGPLMDANPHLITDQNATDAWKDWVAEQTERAFTVADSRRLYAEEVVAWFSNQYGTDIGGWWFDHADYGDYRLLAAGARAGNEDALVSFNRGTKIPLQNNTPGWENYTHGHPNPLADMPPSSAANLAMVTAIEQDGPYMSGTDEVGNTQQSLAHVFMPTSTNWTSGTVDFGESKALEWMSRTVCAGGSWTWAAPIVAADSKLADDALELLSSIGTTMSEARLDPDSEAGQQIQCDLPVRSLPGLVINEVHYHPTEDHAGAEYIELTNPTGSAIELSDVDLVVGSTSIRLPDQATIGAGGFYVIAVDATGFKSAHGSAPDTTAALALDPLVPLRLETAGGDVIDSVDAGTAAPWPVLANGDGPSLALSDPQADNGQAASWSASRDVGGSPGATNVLAKSDGDADCDSVFGLADAAAVAHALSGTRATAYGCESDAGRAANFAASDVDDSGTVDRDDVLQMLECLLDIGDQACSTLAPLAD